MTEHKLYRIKKLYTWKRQGYIKGDPDSRGCTEAVKSWEFW